MNERLYQKVVILLMGLIILISYFCCALVVRAYFHEVEAVTVKAVAETYRDLYEQCNATRG